MSPREILTILKDNIALLSGVIVAGSALLEKFTKLKFWSWLSSKVGKALNGNIESSLNSIKDSIASCNSDIKECTKQIELNEFNRIKFEICDFASSLLNGKHSTLEQFRLIQNLIDEYETTYQNSHNGELKQSIEYIHQKRDELVKKIEKGEIENI